jgi:YVTN family beta-propeller protein
MPVIGIRLTKLSATLLSLSSVLILLLLSTPAVRATPFAYITNNGANNVSVLDTASNIVTATVAVGANPVGVAVHPAGTRVYVANHSSNTVSVIDTATTPSSAPWWCKYFKVAVNLRAPVFM